MIALNSKRWHRLLVNGIASHDHRRWIRFSLLLVMVAILFHCSLPDPLFSSGYSKVLLARDGTLLSARVAPDEQWRFPVADSLPMHYVKALMIAEDRHFLEHGGVWWPSLLKAVWENARQGQIVRGGSTITMQLVRLSQENPPRTIPRKLAEVLLALRLELTYSKGEILCLYAAHAPFGSNVVGLEAASWRYYGKSPWDLSLAECVTLAVLPNNPSRVYPGRQGEKLLERRNRLLRKMALAGVISAESGELAMMEPIPEAPSPLPDLAPHLLVSMAKQSGRSEAMVSTLDAAMQAMAYEVIERHHAQLSVTGIHNVAVLIVETRTGAVSAYHGNVGGADNSFGGQVDVAISPRSSGSILKPFLYAMMLDDGLILPGMLVKDVPVQLGNFRPVNYSRDYNGAVPARRALARSLNIPAVMMLKDYGTVRFCDRMRKMGMTTLTRPASHYGLSVILGGAESTLWELCGFYASMGRTLHRYTNNDGRYAPDDFHAPLVRLSDLEKVQQREIRLKTQPEQLRASSIWLTFRAMIEVARPEDEAGWSHFSSTSRVAWKTGTSYGNRDAWAVGVTPGYVVGVWVGNASGEGRPSLTGTASAAPVMFDIFSRLPSTDWFETPWDDLAPVVVCRRSGHPASAVCDQTDTVFVPNVTLRMPVCPYHQMVHLDREGKYRVSSQCVTPSDMTHQPWFVLPPLMEYYFKPLNPFYRPLPAWLPGCQPQLDGRAVMEIIYPVDLGEIFVPIDITGRKERVIFEVAHQQRGARVFWYLDEAFVGSTTTEHKLSLDPAPGWHTLALTDDKGNRTSRRFFVATPKRDQR
jgi:penicillin-binding protein 1C